MKLKYATKDEPVVFYWGPCCVHSMWSLRLKFPRHVPVQPTATLPHSAWKKILSLGFLLRFQTPLKPSYLRMGACLARVSLNRGRSCMLGERHPNEQRVNSVALCFFFFRGKLFMHGGWAVVVTGILANISHFLVKKPHE